MSDCAPCITSKYFRRINSTILSASGYALCMQIHLPLTSKLKLSFSISRIYAQGFEYILGESLFNRHPASTVPLYGHRSVIQISSHEVAIIDYRAGFHSGSCAIGDCSWRGCIQQAWRQYVNMGFELGQPIANVLRRDVEVLQGLYYDKFGCDSAIQFGRLLSSAIRCRQCTEQDIQHLLYQSPSSSTLGIST